MRRHKKIWWFIVFCLVFCVSDHLEAAGFTKYKGGISLLDGKIVFGGGFRFRQEIKDAYYVEFRPKDGIEFHLFLCGQGGERYFTLKSICYKSFLGSQSHRIHR